MSNTPDYVLTAEQRQALKRLYNRDPRLADEMSYLEFRRTACRMFEYVAVPWFGMLIGIEKDGHTHS